MVLLLARCFVCQALAAESWRGDSTAGFLTDDCFVSVRGLFNKSNAVLPFAEISSPAVTCGVQLVKNVQSVLGVLE